jgi:hypothetical protein
MTSVPPSTPPTGYEPGGDHRYTQAGPAPAPAPTTTNTLAIVSFVGSFFVSLVGIICGHIALVQIKRSGEKGRGFALAGVIIGYAGAAAWIFTLTAVTVLGLIGAAATAESQGTAKSSISAQCKTLASASSDLFATLEPLADSMISSPDEAKAAVDAASSKFRADTESVVSTRLDLAEVNADLFSLGEDLAYLQSFDLGDRDPLNVNSDLKALASDMRELEHTCKTQTTP